MKRCFFAGVVWVVMAIPGAFGMESSKIDETTQGVSQSSPGVNYADAFSLSPDRYTVERIGPSAGGLDVYRLTDYPKAEGKTIDNYEIPRKDFNNSLMLSLHHYHWQNTSKDFAREFFALIIPKGQSCHFVLDADEENPKLLEWVALDKKSQFAGPKYNNDVVSLALPGQFIVGDHPHPVVITAIQYLISKFSKSGITLTGYRNHGQNYGPLTIEGLPFVAD